MKTRQSLLLALGLSLALCPAVRAVESASGMPLPSFGEDVLLEVTAVVQGIDAATREVTLKASTGNVFSVTVAPTVKRFNELKVGDTVSAEYYASLAADIRPPTPEEKATPYAVVKDNLTVDGVVKPGAAVGRGGVRVVRAIVTVESIERLAQSVIVKGPMGKFHTVRPKDPATLDRLHVGDTVIVTYTEALAIKITSVAPAKAK